MGAVDQNGVLAPNPFYPFRLIFHPVTAVHSIFPSAPQSGSDFYLAQLASMAPGPVFEVYAQPTPFSNATIGPIGRIDLLTSPSSSMFGDKDGRRKMLRGVAQPVEDDGAAGRAGREGVFLTE